MISQNVSYSYAAAYLNRLSFSLKTKHEFPFPSNNPLYNIGDPSHSSCGFSLPIGICLVGITTCFDNDGKGGVLRSALDCLGGGRFRLSLPSAATRLSAFEHSFDACGVTLTEEAKKSLPDLASAATSANGGVFLDVARKLRGIMKKACISAVSEQHLKSAIISQGLSQTVRADSGPSVEKSHASFASVGGNVDAKLALEDALALDPTKRYLLYRFGLQPPTGVLLYG